MVKWLRRLICGECDCQKAQSKKRSKYGAERDIDTVQTGKRERPKKESAEPDYDTPAAKIGDFTK